MTAIRVTGAPAPAPDAQNEMVCRHPDCNCEPSKGCQEGEMWRIATPAQAQQSVKMLPSLQAIVDQPWTLELAYQEGWTDRPYFQWYDESWKRSVTREEAVKAKPEAQQPLTDGRIESVTAHVHMNAPLARWVIAREVEKACAEAWGVKLAGIGASGEKQG